MRDDDLLSDSVINFVNSAVERRLGLLDIYTLSEFLRLVVIFMTFVRCSNVNSATLITALVMIGKFRRLNPKPDLYYEITATELLIVATMAASKFLHDTDSDESMCNQTWASNFDYDVKDLNNLEVKFYSSLAWNLFVSKSEFEGFVVNNFIFRMHPNDIGLHKPGRHSHTAAKRISEIRMNRKMIGAHFKWPMAKAMTVVAAAFLAISHSGLSLVHNDYVGFQIPKSPLVNTPSFNIRNQSRLDVGSLPTSAIPLSSMYIPNGSTSLPPFEYDLHRRCASATRTSWSVKNPMHNFTLLKAGVS
ncbi:hypothetical protein Aperf_G00000068189 [Anoplocephala perfoliata]